MSRHDSCRVARFGVLVSAFLLVASSCSDEGGESDPQSGQDVADMIGCVGWKDNSGELFVTEGGDCRLGREKVGVYYFSDATALGNYLEAAVLFGGGLYLVGDNWLIEAKRTTLEDLRDDYGGELSG